MHSEVLPIFKDLFDKFNKATIPFSYTSPTPISKYALRKVNKILPDLPNSLFTFFKEFNNCHFEWHSGKIKVFNLLSLVQSIKGARETLRTDGQPLDKEVAAGYYPFDGISFVTHYLPIVFKIEEDGYQLFLGWKKKYIPLGVDAYTYLEKAIQFAGLPFWQFFLDDAILHEIGLPLSTTVLLEELTYFLKNPNIRHPNWGAILTMIQTG